MLISIWPEGWPLPNYDNPPTRGYPPFFIIVSVITTVVVGLRLYSRHFLTRSLGIDDAFLMAGYFLSLGQTFAEYKALTTWGWNMHLWDVIATKLVDIRLAAWLVEFFFILGTGCTKISILLVYRRISMGSHSVWFFRLTWIAIAFTAMYVLALWLELMLVCRPLDSYWKSSSLTYHKSFKCANEHIPLVLSAVVSAISDIYASVLPMFLVIKLRLSTRQRVSVFLLFSAGLLTAVTGLVRIYYMDLVTTNYQYGPHTHDTTWLGWPVFVLTDVEAHLAIVCASAPALKVFFTQKIKPPISKAYIVSFKTLSRTRSASPFHVSGSKDDSDQQQGSRSHSTTSHSQSQHEDQLFEVKPAESADQDRDLEKFPMEEIVDVQKPLPAYPAPVWSSPAAREADMTWAEDRSTSGDEDSDGINLPVCVPTPRLSYVGGI